MLSRLDRLPHASRSVAQLAAVIGREFSFDLLKQVAGYEDKTLYRVLTPLLESQLVFQNKVPPSAEFSFKHALVRDVAYENLLQSERVGIHKRIAWAIEENYPEIIKNTPELVARHFTEGKEYEKAVKYWLEAGKKASQNSANVEARSHLESAIGLLDNFQIEQERNELELELLIYLGPILKINEGHTANITKTNYDRVIALCEKLPESSLHFTGLWGKWHNSLSFKNDYGLTWAYKLDELAQKLNDDGFKLQACHCKWTTLFHLGEISTAYKEIKRGRKYYDVTSHRNHASIYGGHDPYVCAYAVGCLALWLMGFTKEALIEAKECANWAKELNHTGSLLHSIEASLLLHQFRKDPQNLFDWTHKLEKFCDESDLPGYEAMINLHRGWALAKTGQYETGLALMQKGFEIRENISSSEDVLLHADMFAEVFLMKNQYLQAIEYLDHALEISDSGGFYYWLAEILRRKGQVLMKTGSIDEAEELLLKSISISTKQQSRALQLRSVLNLAELNCINGNKPKALQLLRSNYELNSEGINNPEIIKVKSMLQKLGNPL